MTSSPSPEIIKYITTEAGDKLERAAGEGKIKGELQGDEFVILSDVDSFITALDSAFQSWQRNPTKAE